MISSLPPITGLSPYTKGLVQELAKIIPVHFLGFNHIYPKFLYPGKMRDESAAPLREHDQLRIRNVLNWYNPIGWVIEAFRIKTPIVHAQWWSYPLAFLYIIILGICKLRGKKIVLTVHNVLPHEKNPIKILFNKSVFFLGDEYIVHTQTNKEELQALVKNKPIHVIKHGLIKNPLKGISRDQARSLLKVAPDDKILLCFGHIRDYKGLDIALQSLALIKDPTVKLFVAGKCWEDWDKYAKLIEGLNLKGRVILKIGFIATNEIEQIFRASDIILLPYKHFNSQSGVGALILPFHIPLIVSDTGGLRDYVRDPRCVTRPGDHKELAQKVTQVLQDKTLRQKLADDCFQVEKELSWDTIAKQTVEEVYTKI
jgi:glycosyltransferase involved in cell wall biosynthesis